MSSMKAFVFDPKELKSHYAKVVKIVGGSKYFSVCLFLAPAVSTPGSSLRNYNKGKHLESL